MNLRYRWQTSFGHVASVHGHTILIGDDGRLSHHISISIPLYIYIFFFYIFFILCAGNFNFERWSLDEANPMVQRWQIWPLLAVGYHLDSTRFRHMYNLEDSMVELKHNAQTSKHKHFLFVLESSISELPKCFSTWFAIICFYFMSYDAQFHES